jgi:uncharacterized protein (UPF0147 family)
VKQQEFMARLVGAAESIAKSIERMAQQQAEFLATLPAEEVTVDASAPMAVAEPASAEPTHPYDATCACQACWSERQRMKRSAAGL